MQYTYKLAKLCDYYDEQIILSERLYALMSLKARNTLRKIDVICVKEDPEPAGVFAFDLSFTGQDCEELSEDHEIGDLIKLAEYETINIESFKNKGVDYMFTLDRDIVGLQHHITEFSPIFRQAFKCYLQGDWEGAGENIERCLELWDTDGPSLALRYYMRFYRFQSPPTWNGCRDADEVLDLEAIRKQLKYDGGPAPEDAEDPETASVESPSKSKKSKDSKRASKAKKEA